MDGFWVYAYPKTFFITSKYILTTFGLDIFLYLASLKLSRVAGWGWVGGKTDINENPVVSLDFDFDFGLRLRVCPFLGARSKKKQ